MDFAMVGPLTASLLRFSGSIAARVAGSANETAPAIVRMASRRFIGDIVMLGECATIRETRWARQHHDSLSNREALSASSLRNAQLRAPSLFGGIQSGVDSPVFWPASAMLMAQATNPS